MLISFSFVCVAFHASRSSRFQQLSTGYDTLLAAVHEAKIKALTELEAQEQEVLKTYAQNTANLSFAVSAYAQMIVDLQHGGKIGVNSKDIASTLQKSSVSVALALQPILDSISELTPVISSTTSHPLPHIAGE